MQKKIAFFITFLLIFAVSFETHSSEKSVDDEATSASDVDINAIPPILDPGYRHKKKNQFEMVVFGGTYLGNSIGQTWLIGSKATYWINNTIGFGANYSYSRLLTNRGSPFGSVLTDTNMHAMNGQVVISNDAALRIGDSLMEIDFYATFGLGAMRLNRTWELMGEIGGGVKFYTGIPWLAFRIDLDTYIHNVSQPGSDVVDFDVIITGGLSFLFPSKSSAYEKK